MATQISQQKKSDPYQECFQTVRGLVFPDGRCNITLDLHKVAFPVLSIHQKLRFNDGRVCLQVGDNKSLEDLIAHTGQSKDRSVVSCQRLLGIQEGAKQCPGDAGLEGVVRGSVFVADQEQDIGSSRP